MKLALYKGIIIAIITCPNAFYLIFRLKCKAHLNINNIFIALNLHERAVSDCFTSALAFVCFTL